ncbi:FUSC family protein [Burkholderia stagnalis]
MPDAADQTSPVATAPGRLSRAAAALLARIDIFTPRGAYVARSVVAAALALGVAYLLELETPYSAASTVLLVINPVQGAVIGKGVWRVVGTVAGMVVAFVLMGCFAQKPLLFILGFGLWLGLCVAGMTLLRHFRASGTVVAGYTIGLATYGAMQHPELTFEHVIGRGSTVAIGVLCLSLVSMLLGTRDVHAKLEALVARLTADVARAIAAQRNGLAAAPGDDKRHALFAGIYGIDDLLALGKAESEDLAQRAAAVRHGMASLFGALAGGMPPLPADSPGARAIAPLQPRLAAAWQAAADALRDDGDGGAVRALALLDDARGQFRRELDGISLGDPRDDAALLIAGERLIEQIDDYRAALDGLVELQRPRPRNRPAPVRFHRDVGAAVRNGVRSACAIVVAGAFWLATGWDQGDMMLLVVAPYCALLATAGNPAAGAQAFIKGTILAVPAAFVCAFGILPRIEGFPLLVVALALFWMPGIYATSVPRTALAGLAYLVAFNTLTAATNPFRPDVALFLNQSVAWVLATFLTLLTFRLILPRNLATDAARLRRTIRDDALALVAGRRAASGWQQRQQHRIAQLGALLASQPAAMTQASIEALAALHVGKELLRIRRGVAHDGLPDSARRCARAGLAGLARRATAPARAARHARRAAHRLAGLAAARPGDAELKRLTAAFADVCVLLHTYAAYFTAVPERARDAQ